MVEKKGVARTRFESRQARDGAKGAGNNYHRLTETLSPGHTETTERREYEDPPSKAEDGAPGGAKEGKEKAFTREQREHGEEAQRRWMERDEIRTETEIGNKMRVLPVYLR
jgi:hypothetical protein